MLFDIQVIDRKSQEVLNRTSNCLNLSHHFLLSHMSYTIHDINNNKMNIIRT